LASLRYWRIGVGNPLELEWKGERIRRNGIDACGNFYSLGGHDDRV